jgi:hypothetical protein
MPDTTPNTYTLQFASEPGHDMVWTDHVVITTTLDRNAVEELLEANPVVVYDDETGEDGTDTAIETWQAAFRAADPAATVIKASYVFATFSDA